MGLFFLIYNSLKQLLSLTVFSLYGSLLESLYSHLVQSNFLLVHMYCIQTKECCTVVYCTYFTAPLFTMEEGDLTNVTLLLSMKVSPSSKR